MYSLNFQAFDLHILIRALGNLGIRISNQPETESQELCDSEIIEEGECFGGVKVTCVPINMERLKVLTIQSTIILDSFSFLPSSLDALVNNLVESKHDFQIVKQWLTPDLLPLALRKGCFCYEKLTSMEVLSETKLPPHSAFYSSLKQENISKDDYAFAQLCWEKTNCRTLADYLLFYQKTDVYLLSEVVESYRKQIWDEFNLEVAQYFSSPHLSFDVMLKETKCCVDYVRDPHLHNVVQAGIRGGFCYSSWKYFNKELYAKRMNSPVSTTYLDCNNLVSTNEWFNILLQFYSFLLPFSMVLLCLTASLLVIFGSCLMKKLLLSNLQTFLQISMLIKDLF